MILKNDEIKFFSARFSEIRFFGLSTLLFIMIVAFTFFMLIFLHHIIPQIGTILFLLLTLVFLKNEFFLYLISEEFTFHSEQKTDLIFYKMRKVHVMYESFDLDEIATFEVNQGMLKRRVTITLDDGKTFKLQGYFLKFAFR